MKGTFCFYHLFLYSPEIDFEQFLDAITSKLGNRETKDGIGRIFELFDDDSTNSININNLKRVNLFVEINF